MKFIVGFAGVFSLFRIRSMFAAVVSAVDVISSFMPLGTSF